MITPFCLILNSQLRCGSSPRVEMFNWLPLPSMSYTNTPGILANNCRPVLIAILAFVPLIVITSFFFPLFKKPFCSSGNLVISLRCQDLTIVRIYRLIFLIVFSCSGHCSKGMMISVLRIVGKK